MFNSSKSVGARPVRFIAMMLSIAIVPAVAAQAPKLGPDDAKFRLTHSTTTSMNVMGMSIDMTMDLGLLTSVRVTALRGDTLRERTIIDSLSMNIKSPMMDGLNAGGRDMLPVSDGDSVVVLKLTDGTVIGDSVGLGSLAPSLGGLKGMPANLRPGMSWTVTPPPPPTMPGDPRAAALIKEIAAALNDGAKITYEGIVTREGVRAWKFVTSSSIKDKPVPLSEVPMTLTIKDLTATGEFYVDLQGRVLFHQSTQTMLQEMLIEGQAMQSTATTTTKLERIR